MNLKMKTLAAAVIATAAMSTANANTLLFPYFTTANGAQSIVTLATTGTPGAVPTSFDQDLHYVYNYGDSCTHFNGHGTMSSNDLLQHSLANKAAGGFEYVVGGDKSKGFFIPLKTSGFLTVTHGVDAANSITGDMLIADPTAGIFASYAGITDAAAVGEANYAAIEDGAFRLSWYPDVAAATSWFAVVTGDMSTAIAAGADWSAAVKISNGGFVYDNDENPFSGTVEKTVKCSGSFNNKSLMNEAQAISSGSNGGLMNITTTKLAVDLTKGIAYASTGVTLTQLTTATAAVGAPYAGKTFVTPRVAATGAAL